MKERKWTGVDEGEKMGEEEERLMRVEKGRLIRKGQHSLCDLVNGKESSWCSRRREM